MHALKKQLFNVNAIRAVLLLVVLLTMATNIIIYCAANQTPPKIITPQKTK